MRYYGLNPGPPAFINGEWPEDARSTAFIESDPSDPQRLRHSATSNGPEQRALILTRQELLDAPEYRDALDRWESQDDEAFEADAVQERIDGIYDHPRLSGRGRAS